MIGLMKNELSGAKISEFISLRSKVYTYLKEGEDETEAKKN